MPSCDASLSSEKDQDESGLKKSLASYDADSESLDREGYDVDRTARHLFDSQRNILEQVEEPPPSIMTMNVDGESDSLDRSYDSDLSVELVELMRRDRPPVGTRMH